MTGGVIAAAAAERSAILADARRLAFVPGELVRRAFAVGLKIDTVWAAAGAGLAQYHRRAGITADIREEFKGERLPAAYLDGYRAENIYREVTK